MMKTEVEHSLKCWELHGWKQQGMVLKSVFSSDFFTPFLTIIGRGAQPMIGGGGRARSDVTVVFHGTSCKCTVEIQ